jgi:hypothetical protein
MSKGTCKKQDEHVLVKAQNHELGINEDGLTYHGEKEELMFVVPKTECDYRALCKHLVEILIDNNIEMVTCASCGWETVAGIGDFSRCEQCDTALCHSCYSSYPKDKDVTFVVCGENCASQVPDIKRL